MLVFLTENLTTQINFKANFLVIKTIRKSVVFPVKMDLLRNSKGWQFRTCKSTEKIDKSKNRRRGGLFYRGEGVGWG